LDHFPLALGQAPRLGAGGDVLLAVQEFGEEDFADLGGKVGFVLGKRDQRGKFSCRLTLDVGE
jgi:hypothetical protein